MAGHNERRQQQQQRYLQARHGRRNPGGPWPGPPCGALWRSSPLSCSGLWCCMSITSSTPACTQPDHVPCSATLTSCPQAFRLPSACHTQRRIQPGCTLQPASQFRLAVPTSLSACILLKPRATAITRAPMHLASCTAASPTPPAAPSTRIVWPAAAVGQARPGSSSARGHPPKRAGAGWTSCARPSAAGRMAKRYWAPSWLLPLPCPLLPSPSLPSPQPRPACLAAGLRGPAAPGRRYRTPPAALPQLPRRSWAAASPPGSPWLPPPPQTPRPASPRTPARRGGSRQKHRVNREQGEPLRSACCLFEQAGSWSGVCASRRWWRLRVCARMRRVSGGRAFVAVAAGWGGCASVCRLPTLSPTFSVRTSLPTSTTVPLHSLPGTKGSLGFSWYCPCGQEAVRQVRSTPLQALDASNGGHESAA